tara:strand:+ start:83777 stop:83974 length:198 start_codon:yes stop_codon:yes gene_type:complete
MKFSIGDVVELKSGSPEMTITSQKTQADFEQGYMHNGNYKCTWFEGAKEHSAIFPEDALELTEDQ